MGSFFTNVQIRSGATPHDPLIEAIEAHARDQGMEPVAEGVADRTVVITPPDAGGWIAVWDEATESQDTHALETLGKLASQAMDTRAFSVLVHDSDVLDLRLYEGGRRVDRFDSNPSYFEEASERRLSEATGRPERWASLIVDNRSVDELDAVWCSKDLFAEDTLHRTVELFGCDPSRTRVGYRYASQEGLVSDEAVTLRFRTIERPAWERHVEGPPRLDLNSDPKVLTTRLAVEDELRLSCPTRSVGGASKGLMIAVWGEALSEELVEVEHFELLIGNVRAGAQHEILQPERGSGADDETLLFVDRPDQVIPPGIPQETLRGARDPLQAMEAMFATTVHVNVVGRVTKSGKGTLHIGLVPHGDRQKGQTATTYSLMIDAPLPRPLKTEGTPGSHLLRPLVGERNLVALVHSAGPRSRFAQCAKVGFERLCEVHGIPERLQSTIYFRDSKKRPSSWDSAGEGFLLSTAWQKVCDAMTEEALVSVCAAADPQRIQEEVSRGETPRVGSEIGVAFGGSILSLSSDEVPALALWASNEVIHEASLVDIEEVLDGVVREVMTDHKGIQGFVTCGSWSPNGPLDTLPYETVCGLHGDFKLRGTWLERWVRVPGNRSLWLGPTLARRLGKGGLGVLQLVADLSEEASGALRIALRRGESMEMLEKAIETLLPDAASGREAYNVMRPSIRFRES